MGRSEPINHIDETPEKYAERFATWNDRLDAKRGVAEVSVAKHRFGPTGKVDVHFDGARMRFGDLAKGEKHGYL